LRERQPRLAGAPTLRIASAALLAAAVVSLILLVT
jgi:hypothetical protein